MWLRPATATGVDVSVAGSNRTRLGVPSSSVAPQMKPSAVPGAPQLATATGRLVISSNEPSAGFSLLSCNWVAVATSRKRARPSVAKVASDVGIRPTSAPRSLRRMSSGCRRAEKLAPTAARSRRRSPSACTGRSVRNLPISVAASSSATTSRTGTARDEGARSPNTQGAPSVGSPGAHPSVDAGGGAGSGAVCAAEGSPTTAAARTPSMIVRPVTGHRVGRRAPPEGLQQPQHAGTCH